MNAFFLHQKTEYFSVKVAYLPNGINNEFQTEF